MDFEWLNEVNRLKEKAAEFMNVFSRLQTLEPIAQTDPAAAQRYQALMSRGDAIRNRISQVTGAIDRVFNWFTANGSPPQDTVAGMGNLGVLGVGVAVVAGAVALIVGWLSDAYIEERKLETAERLHAQGVPSGDVWQIVRSEEKGLVGGFLEGIRNNFILFTALGLAAWWVTNKTRKSGG